MSGKTITEVGIKATKAYLEKINDSNNGSEIDLKFGMGLCQWTDDSRMAGLITLYDTMCQNDNPSQSQCALIESTYMINELTSEDYNDIYYNWDGTTKGAAYDFCIDYERPKDKEEKAEARKLVAEQFEKILLED